MMIDIKELRRLAEAATPCAWTVYGERLSYQEKKMMYSVSGPASVGDFEDWGFTKESADYIATANPSAILSLLDHIEQLEAEIARLRKDAANPEAYLHECKIDDHTRYGLSFLPGVSAVFPDECDEFKVKVTPLYAKTSASIAPDTSTQEVG